MKNVNYSVLRALPQVSWNAEPLLRHATRRWRSLTIATARLRGLPRPRFLNDRLHGFFGEPTRRGHFLSVEPLTWGFRLTEPQATGGLAHFLGADPSGGRIRALLSSLDAVEPGAELEEARIAAEATSRTYCSSKSKRGQRKAGPARRIDLLVTWRQAGVRRALAIEAKFGADFQDAQLSTYRRELRKEFGPTRLVLLALGGREKDRKKTARNADWALVSWRTLLIRLERALSDDNQEFARFRRTLWSRV